MTISAKVALGLVLKHGLVLEGEEIALDARALGRVLAQPLRSPQPSPRWDVSAMDGFAVRSLDFPRAYDAELEIKGMAKAGDAPLSLLPGTAIRIMTGALIPEGADAVVPQELVQVDGRELYVSRGADVLKGDHIRFQGEELKRGALVAKAGTRLNSRWIGFLSGLGISSVTARRLPVVALLVSGSELKKSGSLLRPGQIHDSNSPMLEAALAEAGISCAAARLADEPALIRKALKDALKASDLVILSGGVSVGAADYSKEALRSLGVETIFWGVAQKPGKPLFFGKKGRTLVFGLPGNPAAAWVCFHEYVLPLLNDSAPSRFAMSAKAPRPDSQKTLFLKARLDGPRVELLGGQQSHMLGALAEANALARVEPRGKGRLLEVRAL